MMLASAEHSPQRAHVCAAAWCCCAALGYMPAAVRCHLALLLADSNDMEPALTAGVERMPAARLQALQEEGYAATPVSSALSEQMDSLLERCEGWAADVRRLFAKRNSNTRLEKLLATAALAQRRALRQLDTLWVRSV